MANRPGFRGAKLLFDKGIADLGWYGAIVYTVLRIATIFYETPSISFSFDQRPPSPGPPRRHVPDSWANTADCALLKVGTVTHFYGLPAPSHISPPNDVLRYPGKFISSYSNKIE